MPLKVRDLSFGIGKLKKVELVIPTYNPNITYNIRDTRRKRLNLINTDRK